MSSYAIRQLSESDRPLLLSFLRQDPENNQFALDDIAAYGVRGPRVSAWGAFRNACLVGVVITLDRNVRLYALDRACLAQLVPMTRRGENLSGEYGLVEDALALVPPQRIVWRKTVDFCRLDAPDFNLIDSVEVRIATQDDLPALVRLYSENDAFRRQTSGQVWDNMERVLSSCRYYVAPADGRIVSAAAVVGETERRGMIVSVFTAPEARSRGLAKCVVSAACAYLLANGRTPYLFYDEDNVVAGRVYHWLGFHHIGRWLLARLVASG